MTTTDKITHPPFVCEGLRIEPERNLIVAPNARFSIEPRIMDVFVKLASQPRMVVTRDDLISTIWGVDFGGDESLTRAISQLRKTFRQAGVAEKVIETIPKRGYRLAVDISPVKSGALTSKSKPKPTAPERKNTDTRVSARPTPAASARKWWPLGYLIVAVVILGLAVLTVLSLSPREEFGSMVSKGSGRSVAVMSLADMSDTQDQGFLSDGVSQEILNKLGDVPALRIVSRASSFSYKGQDVDMRQVGKDLDVSHIVDGSLRKQDDRMRITLQLTDTRDGSIVWTKSYDSRQSDIFALQDRIAKDVVSEIRLVLSIGFEEVIDFEIPSTGESVPTPPETPTQ